MIMTLDPIHPNPVRLDLPFSYESAGIARSHLTQWLADLGRLGALCDDARLLVSELVGNAVRHARPLSGARPAEQVLRVSWSQVDESTLAIAVTDGGSGTTPSPIRAEPGDTGGRGLAIVDILAHRWWVEDHREATTVHAELWLD